VIVAGLGIAAGVCLWLANPPEEAKDGPDRAEASAAASRSQPDAVSESKPHDGFDPAPFQPHKKPDNPGGSFLESFRAREAAADHAASGPAPSDHELEKQFDTLAGTWDRLEALRSRVGAAQPAAETKEFKDALAKRDQLVERLNEGLASLQKSLAAARGARPQDPVPQWLTGELFVLVGGEPEERLPYLRRAAAAGLDRPRLFASLAVSQLEANQFAAAYDSALNALERGDRDRYVWNAYSRAAFASEKFARVIDRLDRAFPNEKRDWAAAIRREAADLRTRWQAEQQLRRAEEKADDLPRVRLTIEHRRFARGPDGKRSSNIETTGRGDVIIELFEDQAPVTVANFLSLVARGFYDGTRFHLAEPASLVAGGDPKTKDTDASDDGTGGPGYVIPDEFASPKARGHFRGSVSMVDTGPHTAGSQFFITLAPRPEMDGRFTVFGRVIEGQDVVDAISRGRTNPLVGRFGKIIPGDLLVRATVIRKRPHPYRVVKERAR
jgi:peptidyl-prolyl cis-trans isomerase B (cyclophilin B)